MTEASREKKRECDRRYRATHHDEIREYMREYMRKYRATHHDEIREYMREYMRKYRAEHAEEHRLYMREYVARLKEQGRCLGCGKPADGSKSFCPECAAKRRERAAAEYQRRARKGLCVGCGKPKESNRYVQCEVCRALKLENKHKWNARKRAEKEGKHGSL